ncbi:MAG TPA: hypothetical protein VNF74_16155 [Terriglobales bacterium]|nr:hypothetical protein [Terriglobales bacterium]
MPWGAHARGPGVNFSIFCRAATGMRLEFFQRPEDGSASWGLDLDPDRHRTGDVWHVWVSGVESGQLYGYRARGPYQPAQGFWFNPRRLLLDPCGLAVAAPMGWDFTPACPRPGALEEPAANDDAGAVPKSVYCHAHFDWEGTIRCGCPPPTRSSTRPMCGDARFTRARACPSPGPTTRWWRRFRIFWSWG